MSTLLLPELAREVAESNRRVADSFEAELQRLEQLRTEAKESGALKRRAARSARGAASNTLSRKAEVVGAWQHALELLEDGLSTEQAKGILQEIRHIIESWLNLARHCRALGTFATTLGSPPEWLAGLNAAETEVQQVKVAVENMHTFFSRPRPPVNPALLELGRSEIAGGHYRSGQQICAGGRRADGEAP